MMKIEELAKEIFLQRLNRELLEAPQASARKAFDQASKFYEELYKEIDEQTSFGKELEYQASVCVANGINKNETK